MVRKFLKLFVLLIVTLIFQTSCKSEKSKVIEVKQAVSKPAKIVSMEVILPDTLSPKMIAVGLVDVQSINPAVFVDLKYASTDNFMKMNVYGGFHKAYLRKEIAEKVGVAQQKLTEIDSSLHLLIYDAVRPRSVQQIMWNLLDTIPVFERAKFVSNPKYGSVHNFACAVDVTICNKEKIPLDMGARFDDMRPIAYPSLEYKFIANGELTSKQIANRKLLRKVMYAGKMWNIPTEWWHFNGLSRNTARSKYAIIE